MVVHMRWSKKTSGEFFNEARRGSIQLETVQSQKRKIEKEKDRFDSSKKEKLENDLNTLMHKKN